LPAFGFFNYGKIFIEGKDFMWNDIWQKYLEDWQGHSFQDNIAQILAVVVILLLGIMAIKIIGKKSINTLTIPNILFIFVLSSTLGALITKPYRILTGVVVVATIVLFIYILEKLIVKSNVFEQFFISKPTILYKDGVFLTDNISKSKMTIDQIESWVRMQGYPSVEICKTIVIEFGGNLSFELYPEYEPIRKIYFDAAVKQILKAIDDSKYKEAVIPEMNNVFDETRGIIKNIPPKNLE
jgi:uncharacterized membrane protein YcaP (DUF421 family)